MIICGIEIKAQEAIFVVIDTDNPSVILNLETKKIALSDSESRDHLLSFKAAIDSFFRDNHIDKIVIKKRAKAGQFASGADTFKIEGIIQLSIVDEVSFISPQRISSYQKRNPNISFPSQLNKYQHDAYVTILAR